MTNRCYLAVSCVATLSIFFLFNFTTIARASVLNEWALAESLNSDLASHSSIGIGNRLFVFGGATNDDFSEVWANSQNAGGSLSQWQLVSNMPDTRYWGTLVMQNNRAYFLGGTRFPGSENSTVFSSQINQDGIFSEWEEISNLPQPRALGNAVIINNRIYYAGGFSSAGRHSTIFYADILEDGTLTPWVVSEIPLPQVLYGFSMVEHDGYIYVIGGNNAANIAQNKVYRNTVNEDGTLNAWTELNSLPLTNYRGHALIYNKRIILAGGEHGAGVFLDKVYYSDILPGGIISEWQESENKLPVPVSGGSMARVGYYLYLTGGLTTGYNYLGSVYYARLDNSLNIGVPLLKQTSAPWNDDLYDTANHWSTDTSFSRWGCAVTSSAMVFKYHGLQKMSDNSDLDPGALNAWLKTQPDGYTRDGSLNWLALSRLSRQISEQNGVSFEALEFEKIFSSDSQIVKDDIDRIEGALPDILRVPNHFVVSTGYSEESILINDSFYERSDLVPYGNIFQNISRFTPSNTDLSYIMISINSNFDIKVFDESNNEVGTSFIEEPVADPAGEAFSSAILLKTHYLPKPKSGNYRLEINGPLGESYNMDAYLYDDFGNVLPFFLQGSMTEESDNYNIIFNKSNVASGNIEKIVDEVTYETLIDDIKELYIDKKIKFGAYIGLISQLKTAWLFQINNKIEKSLLASSRKFVLQMAKKKQITNEARDEIVEKIDFIILSI